MAIYIPSVDGYIIDNPNIEFQRCDGKIYAYDEVNVANFTDTANSLIINGGQRRSPLSYVDTDRNTEISFTSSLFTLEMFEMANAETIETGDFSTRESALYTANEELNVTLPFEVKLHSIKVVRPRGLEEADEVAAGKFVVTITDSDEDTAGNTLITFNSSDVGAGDTVRISYIRRIVNGDRVTTKTNGTTAKGAFWIHWPVYSSGADCTQSNQKGILHLWMPRCRITQTPGLDGSYKTAQAPGITAAAIDPKRPDKKLYVLAYEDLTEEPVVVVGQLKSMTLMAGTLNLPLSPNFRGDRYEYSTTLPASVTGNTNITLAAELNDDRYTSASCVFGGVENPSIEIEDGMLSDYVTAQEFRAYASAEDDNTIKLIIDGVGVEPVTYTINVTI